MADVERPRHIGRGDYDGIRGLLARRRGFIVTLFYPVGVPLLFNLFWIIDLIHLGFTFVRHAGLMIERIEITGQGASHAP
jgi:hypothetical protein